MSHMLKMAGVCVQAFIHWCQKLQVPVCVCSTGREGDYIVPLCARKVNKLGSSKVWTAVCEIDLLAAMRRAWER